MSWFIYGTNDHPRRVGRFAIEADTKEQADARLFALYDDSSHRVEARYGNLVTDEDQLNGATLHPAVKGGAPIDAPMVCEDRGQCVVAVTEGGYWGKGTDLEEAVGNAHEAGERGTKFCVIYLYTGAKERLKEIGVNGYGDISYPMDCTSNRVGRVKVKIERKKK